MIRESCPKILFSLVCKIGLSFILFISVFLLPASAKQFDQYDIMQGNAMIPDYTSSWRNPVLASAGIGINASETLQISYSDFIRQNGFTGLIYINGVNQQLGRFEVVEVYDGAILSLIDGKDISQEVNADNWGGIALGFIEGIPLGEINLSTQEAIDELNKIGPDTFKLLIANIGEDAFAAALQNKPGVLGFFLRVVNATGTDSFEVMVDTLGEDAVAEAFRSDLGQFSTAYNIIDYMGTDAFNAAYTILSNTVGGDAAVAAFCSDSMYFASSLSSINSMGTDAFNAAYTTLSNTVGEDGAVAVFRSNSQSFIFVLKSIDSMGTDAFNAAYTTLSNTVGGDAAVAVFRSDSQGFISALSSINSMGTDAFNAAYTTLSNTVGEDGANGALCSSPQSFLTLINIVNSMGMDNFKAIVDILGKDAVAEAFKSDPYLFSRVGSAVNSMGMDNFKAIVDILGKDAVAEAFKSDPNGFYSVLNFVNSMGMDNFKAIVDILGKDAVTEVFKSDPNGFYSVLNSVDAMGIDQFNTVYNALSNVVGKNMTAEALQNNIPDFLNTLEYISDVMGVDSFNALLGPLEQQFGEEAMANVLVENGQLMHLERFWSQDLPEIIGNRLKNTPDGRPLAVIIGGTSDYNGAFTLVKDALFGSLFEQGYRVMYYEASTDTQMVDALKDVAKDERASLIIFGGHGNQTTLSFGADVYVEEDSSMLEPYTLDFSDRKELLSVSLSDTLEDGGTVILLSCSTGEGEWNESNLARMMGAIFNNADHVFAPVAATNISSLVWDVATNKLINVIFLDEVDTFDAANIPIAYPNYY